MPVVQTLYPSKSAIISVWKIEETLTQLEASIQLSEIDNKIYDTFTIKKRKKEWLTTRIMVNQLMGNSHQILYNKNRNPHLVNSNTNISISHCQNFVSVFLDQKTHIGIDIETNHERVQKIANKFLSEKELAEIQFKNSTQKLTLCWCIKEAMYKYYSQKKVDFKTQLQIDSFELKSTGTVSTKILKDNFKKLLLVNYISNHNYSMAFVSGH